MDEIQVDERGFIYVDGILLGQKGGDGQLIIKDKDPNRSKQRGSPYVKVDLLAVLRKTLDLPLVN